MRSLHWITEADGPFAAAYYDGSHDTEDAEQQLQLRWRSAREQLEDQGADESTLAVMDEVATDAPPTPGRAGRALVAARGELLVDQVLAVPPVLPEARWSVVPFLLPLVSLAPRDLPHVVVVTDRTGADIRTSGQRARTARGREHPVHKVRGGGWAHRRLQNKVEQVTRLNMEQIAREVAKICDTTGSRLVVVAGEVQSRTELIAHLPPRCARIAQETEVGRRAGGWHTGELDAEVHRLVTATADSEVAAEIEARRGQHRYVHGLPDTMSELCVANVETLLVSDGFDGEPTIWFGPQHNLVALREADLRDLGVPDVRAARADEALPLAALAIDADVIPVAEPLDGGIGALLRHR